ncbi:MAG: hypothetical protein A3F15_00355 [Candidatus Wildermuthbacteria bacterium RIFCSPHIGHO2_12_FULL_40_12]|uniref:Glycosyltransferase subfamily 4-like N-terminal domain-containing protein n=1 Tax=Candidatus Wildermuthbacteria bacterium RIFCSPHIGHO2_12_FULL_40_12 TaxID=1802457 RepID=A0A1G2RBS1_9BACT|nr:MAG: hypothetical protein A3F15_00355 [Candidatus Wildermuthbacteria bacterium RIFCSPHIGHO2_12_FULL_40_12]
MKKVLIISHLWPYRRGSKRVIGLAKYLSDFGWKPIVLTGPIWGKPELEFDFIETDYIGFMGSLMRIFSLDAKRDIGEQLKTKLKGTSSKFKSFLKFLYIFIRMIYAYPDEDKNWKPFAMKAASSLLESEKVDAIISIWPETSHIVAKELKIKYKIPWIADFPDLWSQNYNYCYGPIRRLIDRRLELKTINLADALTTISQPFVKKLMLLHSGKKIYSITHGFDPKEVNTKPANLTSKFTITYTGQIYPRKQDPLKILIALKELILNKEIDPNHIEVRFYGSDIYWLEEKIKEYKLSNVVKKYGSFPREISLDKQRESQVLLLFNWEDKREKGVYTGKIFEYLSAQRPILATGGLDNDVIEDLLSETKAGVCAIKTEDIKIHLKNFYLEYKEKGKISFNGNIEKINKYSYPMMAKNFAEILDKLV